MIPKRFLLIIPPIGFLLIVVMFWTSLITPFVAVALVNATPTFTPTSDTAVITSTVTTTATHDPTVATFTATPTQDPLFPTPTPVITMTATGDPLSPTPTATSTATPTQDPLIPTPTPVITMTATGAPATATSFPTVTPTYVPPVFYDCAQQSDISELECEWLVAIYDANVNSQSFHLWLREGISPCNWDGVVCNNSSVTELYLGAYQISMLPSVIGNFSNLEQLDLAGNQITMLPSNMGSLNRLQKLDLSDNQLSSLPVEIGDLANLKMLSLSRNQLSSLPPTIGSLENLVGLSLNDNRLTSLPNEIGDLSGLSWWLDVQDNPLEGSLPLALLGLPLMSGTYQSRLSFYNTSWCVPDDPLVQNWLNGIDEVIGTGYVCGQVPGSISGRVTMSDTVPVSQTMVMLYRHFGWGDDDLVATTQTDVHGSYSFNDLGQGFDYIVYFTSPNEYVVPQYFNEQRSIDAATHISVTLGMEVEGIDANLLLPHPPQAVVSSQTGSVTVDPVDGTVAVTQINGDVSDITINRIVLCEDVSMPMAVTLFLGSAQYPMSITGNLNEYSVVIPANQVITGELKAVAACDEKEETTSIGSVTLYDPSGYITDSNTGAAIDGALVTLYQVPSWQARKSATDTLVKTCESNLSKSPGAAWSQLAPVALGLRVNTDVTTVSPLINQQLTDKDGHYGWDVPEGCWYVAVYAMGYQPLTSPVVGVPTAVTDLDLRLTPLDSEEYIYLPLIVR